MQQYPQPSNFVPGKAKPGAGSAAAKLFQPWTSRGVTLKNRIVLSPMCMYAARDGIASPFHSIHLGSFAMRGLGLVLTEATAVTEDGICLGTRRDLIRPLWTVSSPFPPLASYPTLPDSQSTPA